MKLPRIENMQSRNGNIVPNQYKVFAEEGTYFQSYSTIVAFKPFRGKVQLDREKWDYSRTTGKYRNLFLRESKKETEQKIRSGEYELVDLNE